MSEPRLELHPRGKQEGIPESASLLLLLTLFVTIGVVALLTIVRGGEKERGEDLAGSKAYGPADFPDIVWDPLLKDPLPAEAQPGEDEKYPTAPPPFSEGIFPCSDCHDPEMMDPNPERRELTDMHEEIELHHGPAERWCLDCHDLTDRDQLRLASGERIGFEESYRLCGQCHGTIYRDWREGIHGRRVGYWDGPKQYRLCANCHNPHHPRFAPLPPLPPPVRPDFLRDQQPGREAHPE